MGTDRTKQNKPFRSLRLRNCESVVVTRENARQLFDEQQKLSAENIDAALVDRCAAYILGDESAPIEASVKAETLAGILQEIHQEEGREQRPAPVKKLRPVVVMMLVLLGLVLVAGICVAADLVPWKPCVAWDSETMDVSQAVGPAPHEASEARALARTGLDNTLDAALAEHDIRTPLPIWIPARFSFDQFHAQVVDQFGTFIVAQFISGDESLSISVHKYQVANAPMAVMDETHEKSEESVESYPFDGIDHYIYTNLATNDALWYDENYELSIYGNVTQAELLQMLDSMRKGV